MTHDYFTETEIMTILEEVVDKFLLPRFEALKMEASGEWTKSLETVYDGGDTGRIRGRFYSYWLAHGRAGNRDQSPEALRRWAVWAGKTFIGDWVRAKGIAADPIAVAYSIAQKGTTWKSKGGSNLLEVLEEPETIKYIQDRMSAIVAPKVADMLRRSAAEIFKN